MSAPVVVVVAPPAPSADPVVDAMMEAAQEGLPAATRVRLAAESDAAVEADVVVVLRWADDTRRRATLRVRTRDGRASERDVAFGAADPAAERGRALGFAAVAMIPEDVRLAPERVAPEPVQPSPVVTSPPEEAPRPPVGLRTGRVWIEATAQGTTAFAGSANALGGGVAVRFPLRSIALRVGGAVRAGAVTEADASSLLVRADAGVAFWTVAFDPRLILGARTGLVVFRHALSRTPRGEVDGSTTSGTHTLFGMELLGEASWALGSSISLIAGAGAEVAFGTTSVLLGPQRVASLPAVRVLMEAGVRMTF
jgi:hypothetical protein